MYWKEQIKIVYKLYGKLVLRILMVGVVILAVTYTYLGDTASAYNLWDITARFGEVSQIHPNGHTGVDFAVPVETPMKSVVNGTVERVRDTGDVGYGKSVQIRTSDGRLVIYAHLNEWFVQKGDIVKIGDVIAESGNTGRSTGAHLHLQVNDKNGVPINPMPTIIHGN